jgi:acyl carrier protein
MEVQMDDGKLLLAPAELIKGIIDQLLAGKGRPPVGPEEDLREAGLSSLDMVNVMLAVEDAFDISLPEDEMTPENFRTAKSIETLVARVI